ncbi:nineteen complex-related protein 2-domain-containing protein [Radiomyces spectabilis]|uniref:nineteen complex-related protein 2-domain-containing protein n=1 Tax=Radiomyces spectabilis TaxID=64574 RepID=UPI00221E64A0|nr:nineteen complex-related protein 2-domain-containing protein [Radiomyces spectabilis]KAI8374298.1 nineteen complex-related protein 2-domain-containing protein [Radiomyces spectabilis]
MFKKSVRTKNIRRKIETSDDEGNEPDTTEVKTTLKKSFIDKKKKKEPKKSLGLSFAEEEDEGDTFQLKKSKASERLASERKLRLPEHLTPTDLNAERPNLSNQKSYTDEYLQSLRAGTPSLPPSISKTATEPAILDDDALIAEKFPGTMNAKVGFTGIADARTIHAARKKREMLRKGQKIIDEEEDFVALDDRTEHSRLIREEDDIGDDGEAEYEQYVGEKLTFDKKSAKKKEMERRSDVREMIEEAQEEDEDEDEDELEDMERWENDLIKHGGVRMQPKETEKDPFKPPADYRPADIPEPMALPLLADVMSQLQIVSKNHAASLTEYQAQVDNSQKGMQGLQTTEQELEKEIQRTSERYDYFQDLSSYVNDLGEFLDAKFPELEKLEEQVEELLATKRDIVMERRWKDDVDDLRHFMVVPDNAIEEKEPHATEDDDQSELDEFGRVKEFRNSGTTAVRRKQERQQRLATRADLSELSGDNALQEQGLWSDDDMPEDWITQKEDTLERIQTDELDQMLADVGDDFGSIRAVKDKFEAWKGHFYDDYQKAFGSLSLPGAFEFYVRCELVSWDPFTDAREFDTMQWHRILSEYGITEEEGHEDADVELLNKVVEKVLVKKIKHMMPVLDVASIKATRCAIHAVEQISYYVEKNDKVFQDLMKVIEKVIEKSVLRYVELLDAAIPKVGMGAEAEQAKKRFFWRQYKYLKVLTLWRRYLPKQALSHLGSMVMNQTIAPVLKPTLSPSDAQLQNEALTLLARLSN